MNRGWNYVRNRRCKSQILRVSGSYRSHSVVSRRIRTLFTRYPRVTDVVQSVRRRAELDHGRCHDEMREVNEWQTEAHAKGRSEVTHESRRIYVKRDAYATTSKGYGFSLIIFPVAAIFSLRSDLPEILDDIKILWDKLSLWLEIQQEDRPCRRYNRRYKIIIILSVYPISFSLHLVSHRSTSHSIKRDRIWCF